MKRSLLIAFAALSALTLCAAAQDLALFDALPRSQAAPTLDLFDQLPQPASKTLPLFDAMPAVQGKPPLPDLFGDSPLVRRDTRIKVYVWSRENCTPCRRLDKDRVELEKTYVLVDGRKAYPKHAVAAWPTLMFQDAAGQWHNVEGYTTRQAFTLSVERVLKTRKTSATYPSRGGWWTSPAHTRAELIAHLQQGQHAGKFPGAFLEALTWEQLNSLHSDDHEGAVAWSTIAF